MVLGMCVRQRVCGLGLGLGRRKDVYLCLVVSLGRCTYKMLLRHFWSEPYNDILKVEQKYIVRMISFWYVPQTMQVKWGCCVQY